MYLFRIFLNPSIIFLENLKEIIIKTKIVTEKYKYILTHTCYSPTSKKLTVPGISHKFIFSSLAFCLHAIRENVLSATVQLVLARLGICQVQWITISLRSEGV